MEREVLEELLCSKANFVRQQIWIIGVEEREREILFSDIMENALKSLKTLKDPNKIESWLKTIIVRRVSRHWRKKSLSREFSNIMLLENGEEVDAYELYAEERSAEAMFIEAESREVARELLDTLPKEKKRIVQMRFWGNYQFAEIAEVMRLKVPTVKSICRRSLKELRKTYELKYGKEGPYDR